MAMRLYLIGGFKGGAGRSLTAALLAYGLHLLGRPTLLIRQTCDGLVSAIEPIGTTLPLPCRDVALPPAYVLPPDLSDEMIRTIEAADERLSTALAEEAITTIGPNGDVVVDLCCHVRGLNERILRGAAAVLLPVRASVFEIDWAVRSLGQVRDLQTGRGRVRDLECRPDPVHDLRPAAPVLLATIAPGAVRSDQLRLLGAMLRYADHADRGPRAGEPSRILVEVPFLDDARLAALFDRRQIWREADLTERCRAFASAVVLRSNADAGPTAQVAGPAAPPDVANPP